MRARSGARSRAESVPSGRGGRNAPAPSMAGQEDPRGEVGLDVPTWPEVLAREASHHFKPAQMVDGAPAQSMSMQRWVAMSRFEQRRARAGDAGAGSPFPLASTPLPRRTQLSSPSPASSPQLPETVVSWRMGRVRASVSSSFSVEAGQRAASSRSRPSWRFLSALRADDGLRGSTTCSGYGHCQVPWPLGYTDGGGRNAKRAGGKLQDIATRSDRDSARHCEGLRGLCGSRRVTHNRNVLSARPRIYGG